ncbi:MAG TPA: CDP-alcohol phosphatidyltransferase family protein [Actinomycetota bacterium]|nr:CDP-alcohol phosphatidyltransferase family protein [Actinomycetota bacterium]
MLAQRETTPVDDRDGNEDRASTRILSVPNVLSFVRLATVPLFIWLFVDDQRNLAVAIYAAGAWTDFFDGYLARRLNQVTELGKLLDPLADRIFIVALAVALVATEALPLWLALGIVARDVLLLAAFPFVDKKGIRRIRVTFAGKTATAALLFGLTLIAYSKTTFPGANQPDEVGFAFVLGGAILYWITAFQYAREAIEVIKESDGHNRSEAT